MKCFEAYYWIKGKEHRSIILAENAEQAEGMITSAYHHTEKGYFEMEDVFELDRNEPSILCTACVETEEGCDRKK